jgi:hypothetical protein
MYYIMKISFPKNIKKYKNVLCLVGLILLGYFILKHFNLIEGMSDNTTETSETTDISLPKDKDELEKKGGGHGGGHGGRKEGDRYGDGNYTVHVNIEAPKMGKLAPAAATPEEDTPSSSAAEARAAVDAWQQQR